MGTSALVKFLAKVDEEHTYELVNVRFHSDGYVDGVGHDLADWLMKKRIVNSITDSNRFGGAAANSVEDLVAQYIRDNKNIYCIGNFYVTYPTTRCDYEYYVTIDDNQAGPCDIITRIDVHKPSYYKNEDNIIFQGKPSGLLIFDESKEDYNEKEISQKEKDKMYIVHTLDKYKNAINPNEYNDLKERLIKILEEIMHE